MLSTFSSHQIAAGLRLGTVFIVAAAFGLGIWLSGGEATEGRYTDPGGIGGGVLTAPVGFAPASQEGAHTAFREDEAGFSAYYRVAEPPGEGGQGNLPPRLNVAEITKALLDAPGESNPVRAGAGRQVDGGRNFGIVEIPMHTAVDCNRSPHRDVRVYFDDRGWIVAYLPVDSPAAGIWRYDSTCGETTNNQKPPDEQLEGNLLVLAINEALAAADAGGTVTHATVDYYDWQNPDCNTFVLFSNRTAGGESVSIKFVVPPTITKIRASAAVLIASYVDTGSGIEAHVKVDDENVATADATTPLATAAFDLARSADITSLHKMSVSVDAEESAASVLMLVYDKPGS